MSSGRRHRGLMTKLLVMVTASFAFGFALVPLYDVFCKLTGIGTRDALAQASGKRVDATFISATAASAGVSPAGILNGLADCAMVGVVIVHTVGQHEIRAIGTDLGDDLASQLKRRLQLPVGKIPNCRLGAERGRRFAGFGASNGNQFFSASHVVSRTAIGYRHHPHGVPRPAIAGSQPAGMKLRIVRVRTQNQQP